MTNSIQSTILNMTTCKQVQDMMDMLEQLQSLCISHYEGLAMQEQHEITKLESILSTTTETYAPRLGEIAQRAITPDLILEARASYTPC
jgi:predicted component of type VI protein secretion system